MNRYDLVVFDLDGTILDTTEGVLTAVKYAADEMGLPRLDDAVYARFIGPPIEVSFEGQYGLAGEELTRAAALFRSYYQEDDSLFRATPYEGIYDVFAGIREGGMCPAVATYKRESYALRLLRKFGFDRYSDVLYGSDPENKLKKKDIILKCMSTAGVSDPRRVLMVGDTVHDAKGAAELGVDFVGVTYGFGFADGAEREAYPALAFIDRPLQLLNLL